MPSSVIGYGTAGEQNGLLARYADGLPTLPHMSSESVQPNHGSEWQLDLPPVHQSLPAIENLDLVASRMSTNRETKLVEHHGPLEDHTIRSPRVGFSIFGCCRADWGADVPPPTNKHTKCSSHNEPRADPQLPSSPRSPSSVGASEYFSVSSGGSIDSGNDVGVGMPRNTDSGSY
eukprot:SAG31_NODE_372_length_16598_cov_44.705982_14_plen_175_part_00